MFESPLNFQTMMKSDCVANEKNKKQKKMPKINMIDAILILRLAIVYDKFIKLN